MGVCNLHIGNVAKAKLIKSAEKRVKKQIFCKCKWDQSLFLSEREKVRPFLFIGPTLTLRRRRKQGKKWCLLTTQPTDTGLFTVILNDRLSGYIVYM